MQPVYVLTDVDIRRAKEAGTSTRLTLTKLVFPHPKLVTLPHTPGGGAINVNYSIPRTEAPEPKAEYAGPNLDLFRKFGQVLEWTFAGVYLDTETGSPMPARGTFRGAISSFEPAETDPQQMQSCNYSWASVDEFGFTVGDEELFFISQRLDVMRFKGEDLRADFRRALGA